MAGLRVCGRATKSDVEVDTQVVSSTYRSTDLATMVQRRTGLFSLVTYSSTSFLFGFCFLHVFQPQTIQGSRMKLSLKQERKSAISPLASISFINLELHLGAVQKNIWQTHHHTRQDGCMGCNNPLPDLCCQQLSHAKQMQQ